MTGINRIVENIQKSNYNKSDISSLVIFLNKISDKELVADYLPLIYDIAKIADDKGFAFESIMILISCHNFGYRRSEIYETIIGRYFTPYRANFEKIYLSNITLLKKYEHIQRKDFPDFENLTGLIMPLSNIDQAGYIKYDKLIEQFDYVLSLNVYIDGSIEANIKPGQRNIFCDVYDVEFILNIIKKTHYENNYSFLTPSTLYFESFKEFSSFLQIIDFSQIVELNRSFFIFGAEEIENYLLKPEVMFDGLLIAQTPENAEKHLKVILPIFEKKEQYFLETKEKLNDYYSKLTIEKIIEKIKNKTVRIGFMVSKWTTALQYYIRDCNEACKNIGIESEIYSEKNLFSKPSGANSYEIVDFLFSFKPDIVLVIDHFRWAWPIIPKELVYICWIQDLLPHLFDWKSAKKVEKLDFILSMFLKHPKFQSVGYPRQNLIYDVLPANPHIYKKYHLSEDEKAKFSTDICIISNSGNAEVLLDNQILSFGRVNDSIVINTIKKIYFDMYHQIFNDIYHDKKQYYRDDIDKIFEEFFIKRNKLEWILPELPKLAFQFWSDVQHAIYKDIPILWLHEKGYKMKLWGVAWVNHPILKKYAMGVAKNGEMLSKILNASKISIGMGGGGTFHPRIMEAYLSGCLYIGNDMPKSEDLAIARDFFEPGKEIIFYKSRKDLYAKVDYYLSNEPARLAVVEAGRKKSFEKLTYEALMAHVLEEVKNKLSKISA